MDTPVRTDDQFDDVFVRKLLEDYHSTDDPKTRLAYRNTIVECMIPVVASIVKQWKDYELEDLFQSVMIEIMEFLIPKWKRDCGSIGGYFRRGISNHCYLVCKKQEREQVLIETDSTRIDQVESPYYDQMDFESLFTDANENAAYVFAVRAIINGAAGLDKLKKQVRDNYKLSFRRANYIVTQAVITVKEKYANQVGVRCDYDITDKAVIFNRLAEYILAGDLDSIIKIFGGLTVSIPKGRYNGRHKSSK